MPIQDIALSQLELSPLNVRKVRSKDAIERMAASIEANGILQNIVVHPVEEGRFGVAIGGTRLAALQLLLKQKKIGADYAVPCDVRHADDPNLTQASLAENVIRDEMHPADEFDAFKKLADAGQGAETIAARFGVSPTVVKQRLKLAVVSPKLIKVYRADEMTLEQLMAFTLTDDHKKQEKVWKDLSSWAREHGDERAIRSALTDEHVAADSSLAKFVTLEAYQKAGGGIMRDLFADEGEGWLTDADLVHRLADEKLQQAAAPFRGEGWKWIKAVPELPYEERNKLGFVQPSGTADPLDADAQAEVDDLQQQADALMQEYGEEPEDEQAYDRLLELQERIEDLGKGEPVWTLAQKSMSGVLITINRAGELSVQRGVVRPEDKAAIRKLERAGQGGKATGEDKDEKPNSTISASLLTELTSHKTVAAQLELADNPKVALMAVTHAMVLQQLYTFMGGRKEFSCLGISTHSPTFTLATREALDKWPAAKKLAAVVKGWQKKLPKEPSYLWAWLEKQTPSTIQALLAVAAATTIDMTQVNGAKPSEGAVALAKAVNLDMSDHWEPTPENYLARVPKKHLLAELNGTLKPDVRSDVEGMKRESMANVLAKALKGQRWVPDVLKVG